MMLALVGIALLLWFGSVLLAYSLGARNATWKTIDNLSQGRNPLDD